LTNGTLKASAAFEGTGSSRLRCASKLFDLRLQLLQLLRLLTFYLEMLE